MSNEIFNNEFFFSSIAGDNRLSASAMAGYLLLFW